MHTDGVGYDFVCRYGGEEVKVEVKTFVPHGRIFMLDKELQIAAAEQEGYFLVGLMESGPADQWQSSIVRNPISLLLKLGQFEIDTKLQASATDVFDIKYPSTSAD